MGNGHGGARSGSGRRRLPSAVKKRNGTFRPSRAATNEIPVKLGRPGVPPWLDEEAVAEWNRICPVLEEGRVLADPDRAMLADYCSAHSLAVSATIAYQEEGLMLKLRKGSRVGWRVHPMIKVAQEARSQAARLGAEFGLSPASRSRVSSVPKPKDGDEKKDGAEGFIFGPPRLVVGG